MQIPLTKFEKYVDPIIVSRGSSYFKSGYVSEPEEIKPGEYEAIVSGSEDYTVQLTVKNDMVTDYDCDCPYDMGPVCKHVVAMLFEMIRSSKLELGIESKNPPAKAKKRAKRKTVAEQVDELLEKLSHDELKQFITEQAAQNRSFRNLFLTSFAHHNTDESKGFYTKQIKSMLKSASDRYGFIGWSATGQVSMAVFNLLEAARKHLDNRKYESAIFICTAVMEQMTDALQYADDSNGDFGGCIEAAVEMLHEMANEQPDEQTRKQIMTYCLSALDKKIFEGWDWQMDMLKITALLLKTEEETALVFEQIDKTRGSDFQRERALTIKYDILLKTKGQNEAEKYLEQNIAIPALRREALQKALDSKNYERAITLARDGINHDEKEKPGLAKEWYDWLLKIAQAQKDVAKMIEYARYLLIDNFRHEQDYYQILKENVKPEEWHAFVDNVVQEIAAKAHWLDSHLIADIYIKEKWWNKLLEIVQQSPSLDNIQQYEKYLAKNYRSEVVNLYSKALLKYLKDNVGRNHYQHVCRYLRRMTKLGAREQANKLIDFFRKTYPQRRALLEELDRV